MKTPIQFLTVISIALTPGIFSEARAQSFEDHAASPEKAAVESEVAATETKTLSRAEVAATLSAIKAQYSDAARLELALEDLKKSSHLSESERTQVLKDQAALERVNQSLEKQISRLKAVRPMGQGIESLGAGLEIMLKSSIESLKLQKDLERASILKERAAKQVKELEGIVNALSKGVAPGSAPSRNLKEHLEYQRLRLTVAKELLALHSGDQINLGKLIDGSSRSLVDLIGFDR